MQKCKHEVQVWKGSFKFCGQCKLLLEVRDLHKEVKGLAK